MQKLKFIKAVAHREEKGKDAPWEILVPVESIAFIHKSKTDEDIYEVKFIQDPSPFAHLLNPTIVQAQIHAKDLEIIGI